MLDSLSSSTVIHAPAPFIADNTYIVDAIKIFRRMTLLIHANQMYILNESLSILSVYRFIILFHLP